MCSGKPEHFEWYHENLKYLTYSLSEAVTHVVLFMCLYGEPMIFEKSVRLYPGVYYFSWNLECSIFSLTGY